MQRARYIPGPAQGYLLRSTTLLSSTSGPIFSSVFGAKLVKGQKQSVMNQPDEEIERKCKRENNLHILSGFDMICL